MIDYFLVQLALLFIPGLLWAKLDLVFGVKRKFKSLDFFVNSFLFGVVSYAAVGAIFYLNNWEFDILKLASSQEIWEIIDLWQEVACSIPVSLLLAIIWLYLTKYRLVTRFLYLIKASSGNTGDDVWTLGMNQVWSNKKIARMVDHKSELVIEGLISRFSETEYHRELYLKNVGVSDLDGYPLNEIPELYVTRLKEDVWLEFYQKPNGGENEKETNQ